MKLKFDNIGKISEADIELNSITVIAGNNDTGKSTVGKLLYALSVALHTITPYFLLRNKFEYISDAIEIYERRTNDKNNFAFLNKFMEENKWFFAEEEDDRKSDHKLLEALEHKLNQLVSDRVVNLLNVHRNIFDNEKQLEITCKELLDQAEMPATNESVRQSVIRDFLLDEFDRSLNSEIEKKKEATVTLKEIKGYQLTISFANNELISFDESRFKKSFSQSFYIDDPFVLDQLPGIASLIGDRRHRLLKELHNAILPKDKNYLKEVILSNEIKDIFTNVINGEFKLGGTIRKRLEYHRNEMPKSISIDNVSTGIKSFSILQLLMQGKYLNDCEFLILDEPEVHLHPEWQLKYAELIVLLTIHYPIRVLLTSHSPYFVEAIELYSKLHKIDKGVRFYKTQSDGKMSKILDVTSCIGELYEDMAEPFRELEDLRDEIEDE